MAEENIFAEHSFVLMGTVTRPHGLKGELKVRPFTAQPASFGQYTRLYLSESEHGPKVECTTRQARISSNQVILRLQECDTRDKAESLVGQLVWLATQDLPPLDADEFYLHTLIGQTIQTVGGQQLGRAENLLSAGEQDILVVRQGKQEYLIPVVQAFIHSIEAGVVTLDLPEGLLEING
ncbi:MAG: ribosome maturation factor RimM [Desulfobulbus sp.]|nr:ribosome maturation factor RimM [Desulfobulbus sp.]